MQREQPRLANDFLAPVRFFYKTRRNRDLRPDNPLSGLDWVPHQARRPHDANRGVGGDAGRPVGSGLPPSGFVNTKMIATAVSPQERGLKPDKVGMEDRR